MNALSMLLQVLDSFIEHECVLMLFVSFFPLLARIGFVTQEDVLFPQLTVEETLIFSALLRLPTNMSKQEKYAKVDTTIKELGLQRCVLL